MIKWDLAQILPYRLISDLMSVYPVVLLSVCLSHFTISNSCIVSQDVTNKSYLVCIRVKNMHTMSPKDLLGLWGEEKPSYAHDNIRQGKAKLRLPKITSVFHHLPSIGPKQLFVLAHLGCTLEADTS